MFISIKILILSLRASDQYAFATLSSFEKQDEEDPDNNEIYNTQKSRIGFRVAKQISIKLQSMQRQRQ